MRSETHKDTIKRMKMLELQKTKQ